MNNLISQYSKYLGFLSGVAYLIGFVIVNSFISNSFMNYGIVNVKYFSIGILYLSLLIAPIGYIYIFSKVQGNSSNLPYFSIHCLTLSASLLYFMSKARLPFYVNLYCWVLKY